MEKYIVITVFGDKQDIKVETIACKNEENLLHCWARRISYPRIGVKSKEKLLKEIKYKYRVDEDDEGLVLINDTQNLYDDFYSINGIFITIYVIKVRKIVVSSSSYAMLFFYRGCDFLEEKEYASPLDALIDCLNIILWQEFSKEEETEIKRIVSSASHVNCVIRNLVWNFECSILGNNLKVYIVKS